MPMRVFLDDERATPPGWVRTYWPDEVITLLKTGDVVELSLDHDLGDYLRGTEVLLQANRVRVGLRGGQE